MIHFNKLLTWTIGSIFAQFLTSCAYRFTNVALQTPANIKTIAIEAVYDTSRFVIPHEILWQSVQNEFARTGRIWLVDAEHADALMTIHITDASIEPTGTPNTEPVNRDPPVGEKERLRPSDFKNLRIGGNYTTTEAISFQVKVKVHHLFSRKIVHERSYSSSGSFRSIQPSSVSQIRSGFLLYQEGLEARFKQLSEQLSRKIVTDFFLATK